jgi:hypothetical protein
MCVPCTLVWANRGKGYHSESQGIEGLAVHEVGDVVVLQSRFVTPHCINTHNPDH